MSEEIRVWQVGADRYPSELERVPLSLEALLQEWLAHDISILDPRLLVIGREVETDFGGYIDLLCMDEVGDLVIVELKRDKTPREITAQALDYASWVDGLSAERVAAIADAFLGNSGLEEAFRARFGTDAPESFNGDHRLLVVGSQIDGSSERIIKYLSGKHGVNINAATFQFFRTPGGDEFLARVFLIEPEAVDQQSRTTGTSKRKPNLTLEDLARLAEEAGVPELYRHAVSSIERSLLWKTTLSSIAFTGLFDGSRNVVLSFIPGESSRDDGLRYQLYKNRFATLISRDVAEVENLMPADHWPWSYSPNLGPEYEGFSGFITNREEIDRLAGALAGAGLGA